MGIRDEQAGCESGHGSGQATNHEYVPTYDSPSLRYEFECSPHSYLVQPSKSDKEQEGGHGGEGLCPSSLRMATQGSEGAEGKSHGGGGNRPLRELAGVGKGTIDFMCDAPANVHLRGGAWGSGWSGGLGEEIHCFLLISSHGTKGNGECVVLIPSQQALERSFTTMHGEEKRSPKLNEQRTNNQSATKQAKNLFLQASSAAENNESRPEIEYASRWVRATVRRIPDSRRLVVGDEDHDSVVHEARTPA